MNLIFRVNNTQACKMGFTHKQNNFEFFNIIGIMYRLKHMVPSEILLWADIMG